MRTSRPAAVAGSFYAGNASALAHDVDSFLTDVTPASGRPHAFIVPHAGYDYSGPIAATVYAQLARQNPLPTRVILLGPSHHVGFTGLALPGCDAFETPLGAIPLDVDGLRRALEFPQVRELPRAHEKEHSLEVQLPFLQRVLKTFTLVPLVVGDATPTQVADVLDALWGGDETVVLVSSDLSHFLSWADAKRLDRQTAEHIVSLDETSLEGDEACGCRPINGLLEVARRRGLKATALDLRSSGDTAGDRSRVVGYGAFAFEEAS
ncbi:MAG: AmmeMemoRadiSam system protein B [Myxococcales bacterium]|nr:AmmeMemoRadiSam system protein B [Myxococcales bacterium]